MERMELCLIIWNCVERLYWIIQFAKKPFKMIQFDMVNCLFNEHEEHRRSPDFLFRSQPSQYSSLSWKSCPRNNNLCSGRALSLYAALDRMSCVEVFAEWPGVGIVRIQHVAELQADPRLKPNIISSWSYIHIHIHICNKI